MNDPTTTPEMPAFDPAKKALVWFDYHKKVAKWQGPCKRGWCTIPAAFDPDEKIVDWSATTWGTEAWWYADKMNNCEYTAGTYTAIIDYTQEAFDKFVTDCMKSC